MSATTARLGSKTRLGAPDHGISERPDPVGIVAQTDCAVKKRSLPKQIQGRPGCRPHRSQDKTLARCGNSNPNACLPGKSVWSGEKDCLFGQDQETRPAFPPPARDAATRTRDARTEGGQRPPGAGGALAGSFAPPAGQGSAWRCGKGDGPCQDAHDAHRRKRFPLVGQAAHAAGTFQHPARWSDRRKLPALIARCKPDEVIFTGQVHDHPARFSRNRRRSRRR